MKKNLEVKDIMSKKSDDQILDKLSSKVNDSRLVDVSKKINISPGHLWNIINDRQVYPLSDKMKERIFDSGILV